MPKYLVQTIQSFRMDYVIEAKEESHALDEVVMRDVIGFTEISQTDLGETVFSSREISDDDYIKFFDKQNDYIKDFDNESKMKWIHEIDYPESDWEFS